MKKLLLIIVVLLILSSLVFANLSDDTKDLVDDLRWKHSGFITTENQVDWLDWGTDWVYEFMAISFDDGILYVTTQDGKWFIEMEKVE